MSLSKDPFDDTTVIKLVHHWLLDAIRLQVSDIHFEPYEHSYRVRFRRDGLLYTAATPPLALLPQITARLKILAHLDIAERRLPQDGHFSLTPAPNQTIHLRVNTCPTAFGEKIVLRLLDPAKLALNIEALGFTTTEQQLFLDILQRPQGMVLVTGPTGSGKTVTLYAALHLLNTPERNIASIEDPIEMKVSGINQVNIHLKAGLDFATALRALLRQDPDVIMVGEMRDKETADIALRAAQTGHFVLSTLHTNSAAETLTRLLNMGIAPFNITASVSLIIAQRLARTLCSHCKIPLHLPHDALIAEGFAPQETQNLQLFTHHPAGCTYCQKGYVSRTGIYELLPISQIIKELIMTGCHAQDIHSHAQTQGMHSLWQAGLNKVRAGITSLAEIRRVVEEKI